MRPDMSSGGRPLYVHTALITGIPIFGKMSVGVRNHDKKPNSAIRIASTMKVYGRLSAMRTMAIMSYAIRAGRRCKGANGRWLSRIGNETRRADRLRAMRTRAGIAVDLL